MTTENPIAAQEKRVWELQSQIVDALKKRGGNLNSPVKRPGAELVPIVQSSNETNKPRLLEQLILSMENAAQRLEDPTN